MNIVDKLRNTADDAANEIEELRERVRWLIEDVKGSASEAQEAWEVVADQTVELDRLRHALSKIIMDQGDDCGYLVKIARNALEQ